MDGTLIEAWASLKRFRPKGEPPGPGGGNAWMDFRGEKRRNDTHESTTDPEAKLIRKGPGKEAKLSFAGHAAMENRHGLCVHFAVKPAVGAPESAVAVEQMTALRYRDFRPKTVGADKGYHTTEFVTGLREQKIVPHPARKDGQKTLHVLLTTAHAISQRVRKRIKEIFGWTKTTGCFRKSRYRGVERTHAQGQYVVGHLESRAHGQAAAQRAAAQGAGVTPAVAAGCPHPAKTPPNPAGRADCSAINHGASLHEPAKSPNEGPATQNTPFFSSLLMHPPANARGITTIVLLVLGLGSMQLFSLSILGDYLGKVLEETKARPRYIRARVFKGQSIIARENDMINFISEVRQSLRERSS